MSHFLFVFYLCLMYILCLLLYLLLYCVQFNSHIIPLPSLSVAWNLADFHLELLYSEWYNWLHYRDWFYCTLLGSFIGEWRGESCTMASCAWVLKTFKIIQVEKIGVGWGWGAKTGSTVVFLWNFFKTF